MIVCVQNQLVKKYAHEKIRLIKLIGELDKRNFIILSMTDQG